jgi:hypothetical protein
VPLFYTILDDLRRLVLTLLLRPERALGGAEPDA